MLDLDTLDWVSIGKRVHAYRVVMGASKADLADRCNVDLAAIGRLEDGKAYKTDNLLWEIVKNEGISANWLIFGKGSFDSEDPPELLPSTIIRKVGFGIRKNLKQRASEDGCFTDNELEFVMAVESFKTYNKKPVPRLTEIYDLILNLGYRKVECQKIHPLKELNQQKSKKQT